MSPGRLEGPLQARVNSQGKLTRTIELSFDPLLTRGIIELSFIPLAAGCEFGVETELLNQ